MGQQPSTLNCKVNQNTQKHQVTAHKQFFTRKNKPTQYTEQNNNSDSNFHTQNVIPQKSPRYQLTRATSQKNLSSKSSRQVQKIKTFIPEHQSITKVSQAPFRSSIKQKKYYVEQKVKSLAQIVETRYNTSKHFPYSQVLGLTQSLVYSLAYMIKKKCNHHDFYPTNIYYSEGKFKIINPLQLQSSGFYLTCQRQRFSFLSPQLIIAILEQASQTDLGDDIMNKSDVFAIGMILLEICSLQPSSECFDEESYNIVDSVIKQRLAKVVKIYTPVMAECINLMLQYEIDKRVDPLILAQIIHWKIQNQKLIAMQMEAPKQQSQIPQQGPPGQPAKKMMCPPPNMPPQQMRGPPPPYMHQPFKLQNLNQNVIAVSMPNQQYTRIGPNNQGFLSSSSLQQKLRVIELIKQHPTQDDQQGQHDSKLQQNSQVQENKIHLKQANYINEVRNVFVEKEQPKPQYPFVESIYSEKPLVQGYRELENNQKPQIVRQLVMPQNMPNLSQPQFKETNKITNNRQALDFPKQNINPYQVHESQQRKIQAFVRQQPRAPLVQGSEGRKLQSYNNEQIRPQVQIMHMPKQKIKPQAFDLQPNSNNQMTLNQPIMIQQGPKQNSFQQRTTFVSSHNYASYTGNISTNSSTINNIYTSNQLINQNSGQLDQSNNDSNLNYAQKYGTSFQTIGQNPNETIEQRVQRVLNMSRNAR